MPTLQLSQETLANMLETFLEAIFVQTNSKQALFDDIHAVKAVLVRNRYFGLVGQTTIRRRIVSQIEYTILCVFSHVPSSAFVF